MVSFEEFQTAMVASYAEQDEAILKSAFASLDQNNDKFLTLDEIVSVMTSNEESLQRIKKTQGFHTELQQFIAQNDTDGNKKLDEQEFVQAMKRFAVQEEPVYTGDSAIEMDDWIDKHGISPRE